MAMLRFCVIGNPVLHSLSPQIHGAAFKALGIYAASEKLEIQPANLAAFMQEFRQKFAGMNVTIPHKQAVMDYLDEIDGEAQAIGAVNTVVNRNGKIIGYNTDSYGAMMALFEHIFGKREGMGKSFLDGKKAVVLGAGGASRAVSFGILKYGGSLNIQNRNIARAKEIADDFSGFFPGKEISAGTFGNFGAVGNFHAAADILINTTPVGMSPNDSETPFPKEKFSSILKPNAIVMDIVYRPQKTRFIREAKEAGFSVITGERMFLHQAAMGFELWTSKKAPFEIMEKALYAAI